MTNFQTAVATLRTAKNVEQWNDLRDGIKDTLTQIELGRIDAFGLIVEVLGKDVQP